MISSSPAAATTKHRRNALRLRNGAPSLCGPGTLWWTTVPFVVITSWTCASNVRPIKHRPPVRNVPLPGAFVIMRSISTASRDGWKRVRCARWTIVSGNSRNMAIEAVQAYGVRIQKHTNKNKQPTNIHILPIQFPKSIFSSLFRKQIESVTAKFLKWMGRRIKWTKLWKEMRFVFNDIVSTCERWINVSFLANDKWTAMFVIFCFHATREVNDGRRLDLWKQRLLVHLFEYWFYFSFETEIFSELQPFVYRNISVQCVILTRDYIWFWYMENSVHSSSLFGSLHQMSR